MKVNRAVILSLAIASLVLSSCRGKGGSGSSVSVPVREFPAPPQVPSVLSDPVAANGYVAEHFWDAFLSKPYPCDSAVVNGVKADDVESALGKFVTILEQFCSTEQSVKAMTGFFGKVSAFQEANPSSNVFAFFEKMVPKYLFDPNSPVRDETLYLPYVKGLSTSGLVSEEMKPAYGRDAFTCSVNMVGSKASDVVFTDIAGKRHNLYGIKADNTLLLFTNPGCHNCEEVIAQLSLNERVRALILSGRLAVVNIYIDLERNKWKAAAKDYPALWYNGYDQDYAVRNTLSYCVRAIPSLYVLDKDKNVIFKDAPIERVLPFLENI